MGLHPSQIITGYEAALEKALAILQDQTVWEFTQQRDETQVIKAIRTSLSAKLAEYYPILIRVILISLRNW